MKILIITDKFIFGGLESQINGYVNYLSSLGHDIYMALGDSNDEFVSKSNFKGIIYLDCINNDISSLELIKAIEHVRQYISAWEIDVIHTHPFISHIIGALVAKLEKKKHVISLHGPASIPNYLGYTYSLLFKYLILPSAEQILCVSEETRDLLPLSILDNERILISRNSVDVHSFIPSNDNLNFPLYGEWVFISRLDKEKCYGFLDFVIKAKSIGIDGVTVIGDGPYKEDLLLKLKELSLSDYVKIKPASLDIKNDMHKYAGVAGMGRVVLEACACEKPAVLVGYDGVKGVVNTELLLKSRTANYSGRGLDTISAEQMCSKLHSAHHEGNLKYNRCYVQKHANENKVWEIFINTLQSQSVVAGHVLVDLFSKLNNLAEDFKILDGNTLLLKLSESIYLQHDNISSQQKRLLKLITNFLIGNNNYIMTEYEKKLDMANKYIEDKEIYIAKLKIEMEEIMTEKGI